MNDVLARIDEWERSGLIDPATATRLREAEAERESETPAPPTEALDATDATERPRALAFSSVFGPGVTVGEMFAYLGAGFLLGAWTAFVARLSGESSNTTLIGAGLGIAAAALMILGVVLRTGDARRRRAAGVAFLAATSFAASAVGAFVSASEYQNAFGVMIVAGAGLAVAALFRRLHPALLTEFGLLAAVTGFGAASLAWIESGINPPSDGFGPEPTNHVATVVATAAGWLLVALVLGLYALTVERSTSDGATAGRRATLIRAWAGLVAVLGLTTAVTQSRYVIDDYGRVIPAWQADIAILILAIILVERAFRRDSGAFLFAAGVGFIAALTDFNFTYLTQTTEVGLLIEGAILLAVGFVADRLRRRLSAERPLPPPG